MFISEDRFIDLGGIMVKRVVGRVEIKNRKMLRGVFFCFIAVWNTINLVSK
jgi:hypothetical protein